MGASALEIWKHTTNVIQRSSYGGNGKKHFKIQKERAQDMASGGNGGTPNNTIMGDTSGHVASIREMHFSDWKDSDFQRVLDDISHWESTGEMPKKPEAEARGPVDAVVDRAYAAFLPLDFDDRVTALNDLAERLGVMDPDDLESNENED